MNKRSRENDKPSDGKGERLQKVLAAAGVGSRRACEELIESGEVSVNGRQITELPAFVDPDNDEIKVRGRRIRGEQRHVYVMLYKPRHTVTTLEDPDGRRTVADIVKHPSVDRLFPVGRLDYDTMGLLLLTNDGELANRLTHPRYGITKTYRAVVKGSLDDKAIEDLERGIFLAHRKEGKTEGARKSMPVGIRLVRRDRDRTILDLTLREGRNREVRRLMAKAGCPVRKLTRIEMGPLKLKGLRLGEWRELSRVELATLRRSAQRGVQSHAKGTAR
ncbi:MAG: pseudouridine synthase [Phycisphaerales bacterium]